MRKVVVFLLIMVVVSLLAQVVELNTIFGPEDLS
jgi:hypothetical protein